MRALIPGQFEPQEQWRASHELEVVEQPRLWFDPRHDLTVEQWARIERHAASRLQICAHQAKRKTWSDEERFWASGNLADVAREQFELATLRAVRTRGEVAINPACLPPLRSFAKRVVKFEPTSVRSLAGQGYLAVLDPTQRLSRVRNTDMDNVVFLLSPLSDSTAPVQLADLHLSLFLLRGTPPTDQEWWPHSFRIQTHGNTPAEPRPRLDRAKLAAIGQVLYPGAIQLSSDDVAALPGDIDHFFNIEGNADATRQLAFCLTLIAAGGLERLGPHSWRVKGIKPPLGSRPTSPPERRKARS